MTNKEKCDFVAKLISTSQGRGKLIQIAKDTNSMDKLGQAIIKSLENLSKPM